MGKKNFFWVYTALFLNPLDHRFSTVNQLVFAPVCTVQQMRFACGLVNTGSRSRSLVVSSSLISSLFRDSMFRMWHDTMFLNDYWIVYLFNSFSGPSKQPNAGQLLLLSARKHCSLLRQYTSALLYYTVVLHPVFRNPVCVLANKDWCIRKPAAQYQLWFHHGL